MSNLHSQCNSNCGDEDHNVLGAVQKGLFAHSEGYQTLAFGNASHAEGQESQALNNASHAEGRETIACGKCSHAQGFKTKAIGDYSVAIGCDLEVSGKHSVGIRLNRNNDCNPLSQPNTFAVIGGKVGVGTLCPENTFEVEGSTLISSEDKNVVVQTTSGKFHYVKPNNNLGEGTEVVVKKNLESYATKDELQAVENELKNYLLPTVVALNFDSGDWSLPYKTTDSDKIDIMNISLNGDVNLLPPNQGAYPEYLGAYDGQKMILRVIQDSTGSRLLTLGGNFNVPSSVTLTLSTDPSAMDVITAMYDLSRDKWDVIDFKKGF